MDNGGEVRRVVVSRAMRDTLADWERVLRLDLGAYRDMAASGAVPALVEEGAKFHLEILLEILNVVTAIRQEWDRGGAPGGDVVRNLVKGVG